MTEVSYNGSKVPGKEFRAEIEFDDEKDFFEELKHLLGDIKTGKEVNSTKLNSEAVLALDKLESIYPNVPREKLAKMKLKQLLEIRKLSSILGKKRTIERSTAEALHDEITSYVDSSNESDNGDLWPLVKRVRIYTNSPILERGLVLVDLPGVGDSNTARSSITLNYLNKLDHIWIVADIVRAVDNEVAKELLCRSFRHSLYMDDRYSAVTFILTKTDDIKTEETIRNLSLQKSVLRAECEEFKALSRKRKRDEDDDQREKQLQHRMKIKCLEARHNWSSEHTKKHFKLGIDETETEMEDLEEQGTANKRHHQGKQTRAIVKPIVLT